MAAPMSCSDFTCEFQVVSDQKDRHPLHLQMHHDSFHALLGKTDDVSTVVAIDRIQPEKTITGCTRLFAVVEKTELEFGSDRQTTPTSPEDHEQNIHSTPGSDPSNTVVYCTQQFLTHYSFGADDRVALRPVQIFPLQKIVVGVTSDQALAWAQNKFFSTGLLLSVCQQKVLVRENDVFLAPNNTLFAHGENFDMSYFFDMKVIACEPVQQGRLTVNTEIVIINQTHAHYQKSEQNDIDSNHTDTNVKSQYPHTVDTKPFVLSDFAIGTNQDDILSTTTNVSSLGANSILDSDKECGINPNTSGVVLETAIIDDSYQMRSILKLKNDESGDEILDTVGLSETTACKLGLFDGSLAEVEIDTSSGMEKSKEEQKISDDGCKNKPKSRAKRIVKVHVVEGKTIRDGIGYMNPGLSFNICQKAFKHTSYPSIQILIKKSPLSSEMVSAGTGHDLSSSWSWRGSVPYAGEVHISIVNSPSYALSTNTSEILKQYFSVPRLVKKGDVLAISSRLDADFCGMELSDGSGSRHPVLYFRVVRIHPALPAIHTYWVDTRHSVLFQDGAVNSFIPGAMPMMLHGDRGVLPPPGMTRIYHELVDVIRPHLYHRRRPDDPVPSLLLEGPAGCGKRLLTRAVSAALNLHLHQVNALELCGDTPASTEARVKAMMSRATTYAPCILHIRNIHSFGKAADGNTEEPRSASAFHEIVRRSLAEHAKWPVVVVASTARPKHVNLDLYEGFLHQHIVEVPSELERQEMLTEMLKPLPCIGQVNIPRVAQRTAGFVLGDLYALIGQAHRHAHSRLIKHCSVGRDGGLSLQEEEDLVMAGVSVTQTDFDAALDNLQSAHSDSIGAPKIPKVSWSDVGGLVSVKAEILDTIQLPLQHPELLAAGLRRSGVLLYGPPGTGKTLLAKAVATECSLNFLSVKGPELINMYVGQSEENIREVFQRARSAAPCVIFFDELDSLAPNRGRSGDSGGVMDRVVSQLLAELDGMTKSADVFVIGATNRPDLLDPALLRPGRFDKLLYLGVSDDRRGQLHILRALTRKFMLTPGWSLEQVVEQCPLNMTGADFYALCSDAMLNALKRKIALLEKGEEVDQSRVEVDVDDFKDALVTLVPSVSMAELARYKSLQHAFNSG